MDHSKCFLCIRREDKNKWEKRTPVIPSHAQELQKKHGIKLCVQPSKIRVFKDHDYRDKGINLVNDLSPCSIIMALKEIPLGRIQKNKVYVFFSHTIKGQAHNKPMLKKLKQSKCTLIDYERIIDEKGKRLIFFGLQAGQSGMIETLHTLSQRLESEGTNNPFSGLKQPFEYSRLEQAKKEIKRIGRKIHEQGLSKDLSPLICGFAGYGRTSKGAQEIFDLLPHQRIKPDHLPDFMDSHKHHSDRLYKVVFKEKDMVEPVNPSHKFNLQDYYENPDKYQSKFSKYLPHLTLLVNCIYWEPKYPVFVKKSELKKMFESNSNIRLRVIGDISCDIQGSIECTEFSTTPEDPFFLFDPLSGKIKRNPRARGLAVMSIDNLPAEIPLESSVFFSRALKPFVPGMAKADFSKSFSHCGLPEPIKKAVILFKGEFTPDYKYMEKFI